MQQRFPMSARRGAGAAATALVAGVATLLAGGVGVAPAARAAGPTAVVVVKTGVPTEGAFRLSPAGGIPAGRITFRVTNAGKLPHSFKLCSTPLATRPAVKAPAVCAGRATATLAPGRSATLTVTLTPGRWAFLSAVPGQAAKGMRGVLAVVAAATPTTPSVPATTTTTAAPTPTPAPEATPSPEKLLGDPVAGLAVFRASGCARCHTLAAAGATGTDGPNLDGRKPSQVRVAAVVAAGTYGGGGIEMPAFSLSAADLANIAAFVYSATHR